MAGDRQHTRPGGITALSLFFAAGALISATAAVALLLPGGPLEPMWRLNPRGHAGFVSLGRLAPVLLFVVSVACATASVGLWRGARWGYRIAVGVLVVNLLGDALNTVLGIERRAVIGIPIVAAILFGLSRERIRMYFRRDANERDLRVR